jgi:hypothetical protein
MIIKFKVHTEMSNIYKISTQINIYQAFILLTIFQVCGANLTLATD